jgi:hypothetical protein
MFEPKTMKTQVLLYNRFATMDMFPMQVSVDDLHEFCFYDQPDITKRQLGRTVLESLIYDPRILKGKTKNNPKACMTYVINDPRELQYGLEWQLCMWIWRLDEGAVDAETTDALLQEIGALEGRDLKSLWLDCVSDPFIEGREPRFYSWAEMWDHFGWKAERPPAPTGSKPAFLRDLSSGRE